MQIPGLDQINLQLPAVLAGAGTISIGCYQIYELPGIVVGPKLLIGPASNTVQIAIQ